MNPHHHSNGHFYLGTESKTQKKSLAKYIVIVLNIDHIIKTIRDFLNTQYYSFRNDHKL